ncbi:Protein of unknown function [Cotesia congregata]|uniref:Uncharacterized protein n=1 Tax=Cotesia congregata TaxID=51543 RepID=A0A8J2HQF5_COTCN|nr:Protein of unknown function [Cotesia congregata]
MSQSGSGDHHNGTVQTENGDTQHHQSNGPSQNGIKAESKGDLSNGFENRTVDYERSVPNVVSVQQVPSMAPDYSSVSQPGVYPTPGRLAQPLPEDRQQQQYQDKSGLEHHVSQTATQTLPVQIQPHFVPDFVPDQSQSQYPQARGQFEVRSQMYNQQGQYGDRVGYVTRDVTYRDSSLYAHAQGTGNPVFTGANAGYVTVQHASQLQHASQSVSPQPGFYPGVIMTAQPSVSQSYGQFAGQSQYTYGQYPQTLINPIPYNPHAPMYTAQQFNQQTSPNPQRYSQEVSQYQGQPIIQSIAQNVIAPVDRSVNSSTTRGPKPMDGLYIDSSGDQSMRDTIVDTIPNDCLYVSRNEHRKSVSDVTTASFPRRNDTITFTFPGDTGDTSLLTARKPPSGLSDKKWTADNMSQIFQTDNKRDPVLRVATVPYDRQENRKSVMSDITNRKPEWGNVSPNQRPNPVIAQENRRSDYFEEHRRSPMPVIDQKRMDDLRRSPMPFISVRDSSCERVAQNSPSYPIPANQNFEKTRQELVIWAEQRQRHEVERTMHPNPIFATSPRSRNPSEERRVMIPLDEQRNKDIRVPQVAFQPIPNISQNTIMEQRRHLRHVSADLTKHMELSRKDFEDQPISGSVANLGPGVSTSSSQRASPNLCHQFPAMSEAKLDTKTLLTVVTDFPGDNPMKPLEQTDHIIHSHKKSHNISACLLTHSKSQVENLQSGSGLGDIPDKTECNHSQQQQQHQQQSLDMIAEKLSQFERQQSDLQARLQCLQNQNHLLDQVAHHQYQHQQSDLQSRLQCLQDRQATEKSLRQAIELQQKNAFNDMHHMQMKALADQVIDQQQQQQHQPGEPLSKQMMDQHLLNRNSAYLSAGFTNQMCQSLTSERLSPRIQVETELERSQITLPTNSQFERNDGTRGSHQYRLMCQSADATDNIVASCPSSASSCSSSNTINVTSGASATGVTFSGTLKKVPPEKPPRTSLIVQSPETELFLIEVSTSDIFTVTT